MKINIYTESFSYALEEALLDKYLCKTEDFSFILGSNIAKELAPAFGNPGKYSYIFLLPDNKSLFFDISDCTIDWSYGPINNKERKSGTGFVTLYSAIKQTPISESHQKLLSNYKFSITSSDSSSSKDIEIKGVYQYDMGGCDKYIPKLFFLKNKIFKSSEFYYYHSFSGDVIGIVQTYRFNDEYFELPFFLAKCDHDMSGFQLQFISGKMFSCYNVHDLILKNRESIVILCDDFSLSEKFNIIIQDSIDHNFKNKFVAISFQYVFKKEIDELCKDFFNREIIYIPSGNMQSFVEFEKFYKKFHDKADIRIYKSSIFIDDGTTLEFDYKENDFFSSYARTNVKQIDDVDPTFIKGIYADSVSFNEFNIWAVTLGIFREEFSGADVDLMDSIMFMKKFNISNLSAEKEYYWDNFFESQSTTLVYGGTGSGKTFFLLTVAFFLSFGKGSFNIHARNKHRVLYIEGEAPGDYLASMMLSLARENSPNTIQFSNYFFLQSYKESVDVSVWDLRDSKFRDRVIKLISNHNINIVVIDNLNCLARDVTTSIPKWKEFKSWIDETQKKYSVAFVMLHHANRSNDIAGYSNIESGSNNVIKICHKDFILKEFSIDDQDIKNNIIKHKNYPGCLLGIHFKKCQANTELAGTKSVYYRSKSADHFDLRWNKLYPLLDRGNDELQQCIDNYDFSLSDRIICYAKKFREFSAKDIEVYFKLSRSTVLKCIVLLKDRGIYRLGSGRATSYRYRSVEEE